MRARLETRYAPLVRWFHWTSFGLVALAYVAISVGDGHGNALAFHALAGIAVLLLALARLGARVVYAAPAIVPPLSRWNQTLSRITHVALYAFLIAQPIMGLVAVQLAGKPIDLFGHTVLPIFFGPGDPELAERWEDVHEAVGEAFYYVIGLHILGALWHQFGRKDNTLRRMI